MFQRRRPIFHKVSRILKVSIFRRPIIPRLKLPINQRRSAKRVKQLQQYNYKFLQEYQFLPSRTSLIRYCRKRIRISRSGLKHIYDLLIFSRCIGQCSDECVVDTITQSWIEMEIEPLHCAPEVASPLREFSKPFDCFHEDDSIDLKAERFIQNFYHKMRMQKREFYWLGVIVTFWITKSFMFVLISFSTSFVLLILSPSYLI